MKTDPDRLLKEALFANLKAGRSDASYGGVAAGPDGEKAFIKYTVVVSGGVVIDSKQEEDNLLLSKSRRWKPIESMPEKMKDGKTYFLLAGPSGYTTVPFRVEVCRYDIEYRPRQPWVTYSNDSFLDSGGAPTHWAEYDLPDMNKRLERGER